MKHPGIQVAKRWCCGFRIWNRILDKRSGSFLELRFIVALKIEFYRPNDSHEATLRINLPA